MDGRLRSFRKERGWPPSGGQRQGNRDAAPIRLADATSMKPPATAPGYRSALARPAIDVSEVRLPWTRPETGIGTAFAAMVRRDRFCREGAWIRSLTHPPTGEPGERLGVVLPRVSAPRRATGRARPLGHEEAMVQRRGRLDRSPSRACPGAPPRHSALGATAPSSVSRHPNGARRSGSRDATRNRAAVPVRPGDAFSAPPTFVGLCRDCHPGLHASTVSGRHDRTSSRISSLKPSASA